MTDIFHITGTWIVQEAIALADGDVLHIKQGGWGIFNLDADDNAIAVPRVLEKLQGKLESIMKGKYDHFMQKEIFEQPESIHATMLGRVKRVCHNNCC
jgi:glutamine---fructose-6-phosphate transaminase (isomerizing)